MSKSKQFAVCWLKQGFWATTYQQQRFSLDVYSIPECIRMWRHLSWDMDRIQAGKCWKHICGMWVKSEPDIQGCWGTARTREPADLWHGMENIGLSLSGDPRVCLTTEIQILKGISWLADHSRVRSGSAFNYTNEGNSKMENNNLSAAKCCCWITRIMLLQYPRR